MASASSPYQIVDELSFAQKPKDQPSLQPRAAPPAAAPPSPPPTPDAVMTRKKSTDNKQTLPPSYQNPDPADAASVSTTDSRAVAPPTIRHADEEAANNLIDGSITNSWRARLHQGAGNAFLNPNIGLTNSYDAATCPPPHDMVRNIRITTTSWALLTILWTLWTWWMRLLFLHWITLAISIVAACLALALVVTELGMILSQHGNISDTAAAARRVLVSRPLPWLQSQPVARFLLYTPTGKLLLLFIMAALCFLTAGFVEFFLGLGYVTQAIVIGVLSRDENFSRLYYPPPLETDAAEVAAPPPQAWSTLTSGGSGGGGGEQERASLVQQAQEILRPNLAV